MRARVEYWLLTSFLLGILIAYTCPFEISLFSIVVNGFVATFMFFAPIIVFVIIFNSTCSLMSQRDVAGGVIETSVIFFGSLVVGCSLFASAVLSSLLRMGTVSRGGSLGSLFYIIQTVLSSSLRPVSLALLLAVTFAFLLRYTSLYRKVVGLSALVYRIQERALRMLVKIFPVIAVSLGGTLYYNLGRLSLEVYAISMGITLLLGLSTVVLLLTAVRIITHRGLKGLSRYSVRVFATGLTTGSSYLALPLNLKIFKECFADDGVGDLVLTLGASLNRCGSVMGVLVVTFVAARYIGFEIYWQQMLLLAIPVALIGFGSPGIQGGTLLVAMPLILDVIAPPNVARFTSLALALFAGGTTFIQTAVNNVMSGYVGVLIQNFYRRRPSAGVESTGT